jgi:hypothetical protein
MSGPVRRGNGKFPFGRAPTPLAQGPSEVVQLGDNQVAAIRQLAKAGGLPPSLILNTMVDCAVFHAKAAGLDGFLATLIAQANAPQQATPPPEPPAPEETVEGSAEDRLKAHREAAGMDQPLHTETGLPAEPVTVPAEALGIDTPNQ